MIRLGLCCIFRKAPIRFRRTTAAHLGKFPRAQQLARLGAICRDNAHALAAALAFCRDNGIGAFRVNSQILPLKTHPEAGYKMTDLPDGRQIVALFRRCGTFRKRHGLRISFHPDQFIVLSSPDEGVVARSVAELRYQNAVADWLGADVINLHAGGGYGDKTAALNRLAGVVASLPDDLRARLTLENDDRTYTPRDLIPLCERLGIGFVYDVHHHRCLPDGIGIAETTRRALGTWAREPLFHLSSPAIRHGAGNRRLHHDYIAPVDFPDTWAKLDVTVEVEAKAKELAVLRLGKALRRRGVLITGRLAPH